MLLTYWEMRLELTGQADLAPAPEGVVIRRAHWPGDLAAIARLYGKAFDSEPWPEDWASFPGYDPQGVLVAETAGEAIGFLVSYTRGGHGYISVVGTTPAHRRRGIARGLILRALERFRALGLPEAVIDVRAENTAAIRCYESVGFRKTREFVADEMCRTPKNDDAPEPPRAAPRP